jgi:hypothetical protein
MRVLHRLFERVLWGSRLTVLVAVVFSVLLAPRVIYLGTKDL